MKKKGYKILVISDQENDIQLFKQLLSNCCSKIKIVDNIVDGLNYLSYNDSDCLILTDLKNKYESVQCLRQLNNEDILRHIPLLYISDKPSHKIALEAMRFGASEYIHKSRLSNPLLEHCIESNIIRSQFQFEKTGNSKQNINSFDPLTRMLNRQTFNHIFDKFIASATRYQRLSALFIVHLNDIHTVNNKIDSDAGNELLQQVTERIREALRIDDVVARIDGDTFAIILNQINHEQDAGLVAQKLSFSLNQTYILGKYETNIDASIGIICFKDDKYTRESLLQKATHAMEFTKMNDMSNYNFYEESSVNDSRHQITLEQQLLESVNQKELFLLYQPICHIPTQIIVGFEVLLRWHNRTLNQVIMPDDLIPLAKKSGFIFSLENWVINCALKQLKLWQDNYYFNGNMAINLSPGHLCQDNFIAQLSQVLTKHQINVDKVSFELTEKDIMENKERLTQVISNINQAGIHLQIDDFGTGYSSLRQLKALNINAIKIDREFIKDIGAPEINTIIESMLVLANSLDVTVIAEGIETKAQQLFLSKLGCLYGQGYFYSNPITRHSANEILKKYAA